MDIQKYIKKLQALPESKKKIVFFSIMTVVAIVVVGVGMLITKNNLADFGNSLQAFQFPAIEIPDNPLEKLATTLSGEASPENNLVDWKTYHNSQFAYQIQYASGWEFREFPYTKSGAAFHLVGGPEAGYESIAIDNHDRPKDACDMPFEEYVKVAFAKESGNGSQKLRSMEKIEVSGSLQMYQTFWDDTTSGGKEIVVGPITYIKDPAKPCTSPQIILYDNAYLDIYHQMVSTFAFTP